MFRSVLPAGGPLVMLLIGCGLALATAACNLNTAPGAGEVETSSETPPIVALASPRDGSVYVPGVGVNVQALITNAGTDIDRVEIALNETLLTTLESPNTNNTPAFNITHVWQAAGVGEQVITVTAFRANGVSNEASATFTIAGDAAQPQIEPFEATLEVLPDAMSDTTGGSDDDQGGGGMFGSLLDFAGGVGAPDGADDDSSPESMNESSAMDDESMALEEDSDTAAQESSVIEEPARPEPAEGEMEADMPEFEPTETPAPLTARALFEQQQGVNVRSGPSISFDPPIGAFSVGEETDIIAINSLGDWYKVRYLDGDGWVAAGMVTVIDGDVAVLPIELGPPTPTPAQQAQ